MPVHKTISREVTLYTLDEMLADEKLKKNILDANREPDQVMEVIIKDKSDDLAKELEDQGFEDVEIYYDLSYCQGSGACFEFNGCNILKIASHYPKLLPFINNIKWLFKDWARRGKIDSIDSSCDFKTKPNSFANHYCHEKTRDIYFNLLTELDTLNVSSDNKLAIDEFQQIFRRLYIDICLDIRNKLRAEEEYYQSDDYTKELLESNYSYCYFYENGTICDEFNKIDTPPEESSLLNNITGFMYSKNSYVIIDKDGKILSWENPALKGTPQENYDFFDTSDEEDKGLSKAIIFSNLNEANDFIVDTLIDDYETISVEQAFRKEE